MSAIQETGDLMRDLMAQTSAGTRRWRQYTYPSGDVHYVSDHRRGLVTVMKGAEIAGLPELSVPIVMLEMDVIKCGLEAQKLLTAIAETKGLRDWRAA